VTLIGSLPLRMEHSDFDEINIGEFVRAPQRVYARLTGQCSVRAFGEFKTAVVSVLRMCISGIRSMSRLVEIEAFRPIHLPYALFEVALNAYFAQPERKDSIDRRIRNAVHLLVESRRQQHNAIGLSLSVAAIEALLCDKKEGISTQISENVAVLLEPDSRMRADAKTFVKKLYDARSTTLHGTTLEHERSVRRNAWALAFAVFRAILERQKFQKKAGFDVEVPTSFFQELEHSKFRGGEIPGVSRYPVRKFWNPSLDEEELGAALQNLRRRSSRDENDDEGEVEQ
jgi:hypothetical protein